MPETAEAAVARLQSEVDRTLAALLPRGTRAALINYPNHHNVGDPALYVGTLRTLRRIGVHVTYRCERSTYARRSLAAELSRGTDVILINGGGNLGDQYPQHEVREQVLADFPDVPTVQLPQSIWFAEQANLDSFAALVARHRNLVLLLRDEASYATAQRSLSADARLCPDLAFGLGRLPRLSPPTQDIVLLRRTDRESSDPSSGSTTIDGVSPVDWMSASPSEAVRGRRGALLLRLNHVLTRETQRRPSMWRLLAATFEPLALARLNYGCQILGKGRVVVTDRLHGVVLSLLMGIPVVAVDNINHKLTSFISTWLPDETSVRVAPDHMAGLELARLQLAEATEKIATG